MRSGPRSAGCSPIEATPPRFIAGPENRLAVVAVRALLAEAVGPYDLVVFYGPPGAGKSHLAAGLAAAWKVRFRQRPVVSATAPHLARQLAHAIDTKTADDFATRYRRASLLVVEDVQHLQGKRAAQQELISILDALGDTGGQIILTAGRAPAQLTGITPSLRSRLAAGLTVPLALPGPAARLALLQCLAALRGVKLEETALQIAADGVKGAVPELFAAIAELELSAKEKRGTIDAEMVRRFLARRGPPQQPSLRSIATATAREFSLTAAQLRSSSRHRPVALARGVAMHLARSLTGKSLTLIGRYFGRRDHTTVSYACRKTRERLETQPEIRHTVIELQNELTAPQPEFKRASVTTKRIR